MPPEQSHQEINSKVSVLVAERRGNFFFEERGNSKKRQSKERFILLYTCPKNSSPSSR